MRYVPGRRIRAAALVVVLGLVATGIAYAAIPSSVGARHARTGPGYDYKVVTRTRTGNAPHGLISVTVTCPQGTVVLGGGGGYTVFVIPPPDPGAAPGYQMLASHPVGHRGWTAIFYQSMYLGSNNRYAAEAYAICASLT